ncbi:MAG: hypothetical protein AAF591_07095 [Verrucomicrobiota bacterium]
MSRSLSILILAALLLIGCVPEQRFAWSPDGDRAIVLEESNSFLVDAQGNLVAELPALRKVEWLPDGSGIVAHQITYAKNWNKFSNLLGEERAESIEKLSREIPNLLETATLLHGDGLRPIDALTRLAPDRQAELTTALLLASKRDPALLPNPDREAQDIAFRLHDLILMKLPSNLAERDPDADPASHLLDRGLQEIGLIRVSPDGKAAACSRKQGKQLRVEIEVVSLDDQFETFVADQSDDAFTWTKDGRALVTVAPLIGEFGLLKQIRRVSLLDAKDRPLPADERTSTGLLTAVVPVSPSVSTLPDGRILFAADSGSLPLKLSNLVFDTRLYVLDPDSETAMVVDTAKGALPSNLSHFVPSPDGKRVAIVESASDAVAVVDLDSAQTEVISPPHLGWQSRTLPSWKSPTELTFASLDTETGNVRWTLWNAGTGALSYLSNSWPQVATAAWLQKKRETETTSVHDLFR